MPQVRQKYLASRMRQKFLVIRQHGQRQARLFAPIPQLVSQQLERQVVVRLIALLQKLER